MRTTHPALSLASVDQLACWAGDPGSALAFSPLSDTPLLLVDSSCVLDTGKRTAIAQWLRSLPSPCIAVGAADSPLAQLCDTSVPTLAAADPLIERIRQAPRAAAILVHVLRLTEALSVEDGLLAESMAYATLQGGAEFLAWLAANRASRVTQHDDTGPAVLIERADDTLHLTLNRASNRNAMSVEMRDALCEALQLVLADDSIDSVRLSARGKCFSTGGDLSEFGSAPDTATAHVVRTLTLPGRLLQRCTARVSVEVHGACIGSGIEFPAFAGRIAARRDAWFQLPELKYGLIPGAGGCISIARRIGRQRTAWMVLSGARIDARTALTWGLIDVLIDDAPH